jgi:hypothetical protein
MHFCKANIALGGDDRNVVVRTENDPVSWPEIEILRLLHGGQSITEVQPFARVTQPGRIERERLAMLYGDEVCAHAWGGRSAPAEMDAPDVHVRGGVSWFNPLTREYEITEADESVPFDEDEPKVPIKKRA